MKSLLAAAILSAAVLVPHAQASSAKVGESAPAFTLTDSKGQTHSLSDFAGKTVVLEWTNHECPFVKKHYGAENMQAQQSSATADGVVWLTVNSSAPGKQGHVDGSTADRLMAEYKAASSAYLMDASGDVGRSYAAKTTPHMYVIDPDGVLRYAGAIDSIPSADKADIAKATQFVTTALAELSQGKPVSQAVTQPYGCAVKY